MTKARFRRLVWMLGSLVGLGLFITGCGSTGVTSSAANSNQQPPSTLSASQNSIQFGNVPVGTAAQQTLTFTNPATNSSSVTVTSVQVSGAGFSITQPPAVPFSVAPGQSVSAIIQALPAAAGAMTGTVTAVSNASPSTITVNLSATGVTPTSTQYSVGGQITPASLVFGGTVTLAGNSSSTVTIDSNGNFTFLAVSNGTYTITPSATNLTFAPSSQQITVNGANVTGVNFVVTFSISGSLGAAGSGATVTLSGPVSKTVTADSSGNFTFSGVPNGTYTITPTKPNVSFSPASQQVTVNNANISGSSLTFVETFSISGSITPASSGSGATVTLTGSTTQQATADANGNFVLSGISNGTYTLTPSKASATFSPASQSVTVSNASVSGITFAANGQLSLSSSTFTFGSVNVGGSAQPQSATLSAVGGDVALTSDALTGAGFGVTGISFPLTIASGTSASISVTFSPTSAGNFSGSLSFNSGPTALATASLSGTGAGLAVSSTNLSFGSVLDGTSSSAQVVTLSAVGAAVTINTANLSQSGGGGSAFSITNLPTLPFSIAAGQTAQFDVTFAPAAGSPGNASGTLTFGTNVNNPVEMMAGTGQSNVLLTWSASTAPNVSYNVYRCSVSASACVQSQPGNFSVVATGIGALAYTDGAVSSGQTYYYALTSVDTNNLEGPLSTVTGPAVIP